MAKIGTIILGAIGVIIGLVITAIGMYAVGGLGFSETTWEIMGRVMQSYEWGMYLTIIGIVVLLIGVIVTYFGFKKN